MPRKRTEYRYQTFRIKVPGGWDNFSERAVEALRIAKEEYPADNAEYNVIGGLIDEEIIVVKRKVLVG